MAARPKALDDQSAKPVLRPGSPVSQCAMCNNFYSGPSVFDMHLIGFEDKCMSPKQMRAIGMVTNEHGVWLSGRNMKGPK